MQSGEKLSCLIPMFPNAVEPGNTLLYYFSSHSINKCPSSGTFSVMLFAFLFLGNFAV